MRQLREILTVSPQHFVGLRVSGRWLATVAFVVAANMTFAGEAPDFNREIRPLLSDRCLACHGPDAEHREAELRLDDFSSLTADRDGYQVVVPGDPEASEFFTRITSTDEDIVMPPAHLGKALTPAEIDVLRRWIESGAVVQKHWAYVAPVNQPAPLVKDASWSHNWIDTFILAGLESRNLSPSPEADPVTLIRRLHLDLTGLPPSVDTAHKYVADPSDQAYEAIVDDLLASDAHAERLTMYWLDLVRFADTVGYHGDQDHNSSPYRDWVIDAFADNMPFDQFTREQLAGDLLPGSTVDQKIASCYNRLLQTSHEGGLQPKEYLAIYAADRVRNVSAVWMGATVGCAQCHDHKYDPYTAKDFYSLAAFFADIDEEQHFKVGSNSLPTKRPPEIKVHTRRERNRLADLTNELAAVEKQLADVPTDNTLLEARKTLGFAIDDLNRAARLTMVSVAKEPREMRLLPRGNWLDDSGPIVQPAVPEFLGHVLGADGRATRLDLANWFCDNKNGSGELTARVFANRFWYLMFGRGLSPGLDDFGGQGFPPEHPKLLDQLALEFVNSNWNVRHVLKLIVTSRTYRQSSAWSNQLRETDPENAVYARQSNFRLPAEMIRDSALDVSGLLVRKIGGASVKPYQPAGYYRHLNFPVRKYVQHDDDRQWRRGLYVHWQRQFLHPMMKAFDAPSREECTAQRPLSNTPLAALTLLNDPTFVEAARGLADRILSESPGQTDDGRIRYGMMRVVSRVPDSDELLVLKTLLTSARARYADDLDAARLSTSAGLSETDDTVNPLELAAWTTVARALLNLDETITRY